MKSWFSITNHATAPAAEISIYDEIGLWGITAKDFSAALALVAKDRPLVCKINSGGGSVFDGLAIYNMLAGWKAEVTTEVMGLAASIASVIFCAGKTRRMASNSFLFMHNASTFAAGDSEELRKNADLLDKLGDSITGIYAAKSGKTQDECKTAMADETWLNATDAKEFGLCNEITSEVVATNNFDFRRFRNGPKELAGTTPEPVAAPTPNIMTKTIAALATLKMVASAGLSDEDAALQAQASIEALQNKLTKAEAELAEATKAKTAALKNAAETAINAAVAAGKIKDDAALKAKWVTAYMANENDTKAFIDNIEVATPINGTKKPFILDPKNENKGQELTGLARTMAAIKAENSVSK